MSRVASGLALLVLVAAGVRAQEPAPDIAAALDSIKNAKTVDLGTVGRKSGKLHTRPVWFVVRDTAIIVQAGKDGKTDWYRNLGKKPEATVRQGTYSFRVKSAPVTDAAEVERIHKLFTDKYAVAWLGSFVGSSLGRGQPVVLTPEAVSARQ